MFNFKKKQGQTSYIKFSIQEGDEICKVTTQFSSDTDPERFGVMLSMIEKGFVGDYIENTLMEYAKNNSLEVHTNNILEHMHASSAELEDDFETMRYAEDYIKEFYPIAPSWGDPELIHMYDPTIRNNLKKTVIWHYLENKEDAIPYDEELDKEDGEDTLPPKAYAVDGAPGFLSESQFRRLQDSEKPNYEIPPYDMWVGYTSFTLGEKAMKLIANSNGVEYIKVIGRYSFIIAIAKAFEFGNVRREIEDRLDIKREKTVE